MTKETRNKKNQGRSKGVGRRMRKKKWSGRASAKSTGS
jgi:hypothetical protein